MKNTAIHTTTQEEYDEAMRVFEEKHWRWVGGDYPTRGNPWYEYKEETCIWYKDKFHYSEREWYEDNNYTILSFKEWQEEEGIVEETQDEPAERWAYVSQRSVEDAKENGQRCLLLATLPEGVTNRYVCITYGDGVDYLEGMPSNIYWWNYIAEISEGKTIEINGATYNKEQVEKAIASLTPIN